MLPRIFLSDIQFIHFELCASFVVLQVFKIWVNGEAHKIKGQYKLKNPSTDTQLNPISFFLEIVALELFVELIEMDLELLFCKSKVFVHPSRSAVDNVPGFLIISREAHEAKHDSVLAWIPERSLDSRQLQWLNDADLDIDKVKRRSPGILSSTRSSWSFSMKIGYLYSIEFRPPSTNGWWYGSVVLHSKCSNEDDSLPVLFFHDDICPSTELKRKELNKSFDPFSSSGEIYWGGVDFRDAIASIVDLQRTALEPTIWLINATLDDLRNFSPQRMNDDTGKDYSNDLSVNDVVWNKWESAKWGLMSRIADATSKTGSYMGNLIRQHPLVKFAERNSDNPYVRKLLANPRVQEVQDDFDSARVYLAKWALGVKQQADDYQRTHEQSDIYRSLLKNELGIDGENDVQFTDEELNRALERNYPVTKQKWDSFFDSQGRLMITVQEVKDHIFHGGIQDMELRKEVWMFLFGVYFWDSSTDERLQLDQTLREVYEKGYKESWTNRKPHEDAREEEYWQDQIFRIDKDVKRNDRHMDIFKYNTADGKKPESGADSVDEPGGTIDEGSNNWILKNPHLISLKNILVSYNSYNPNLGYVQGMCDLLSPIYYVVRDEALAFWCFVNFMERMERNFLRDQSGIRDQMYTLSELCRLMLPKLSDHLNKCDSSNLFFCFRMLLVWFKREFEFKDVCSIWEVFLTDYYSSQFQLFFMLAILQKNSEPIIQNLNQFDQVLKYFNDMHGTMDWNDLTTRAELLFVRFAKMMSIMSRKKELLEPLNASGGAITSGIELHDIDSDEETHAGKEQLPCDSKYLRLLLSKEVVKQREGPREPDSVK